MIFLLISTLNRKTPYVLLIEYQSLNYTFRSIGTADEYTSENNPDHEVNSRCRSTNDKLICRRPDSNV